MIKEYICGYSHHTYFARKKLFDAQQINVFDINQF